MKTPKSVAMFAKVDEWKQSGQTLRSFATSIGLSKSTLEYWVRKKREAFGARSAGRSAAQEQSIQGLRKAGGW